MRLLPHLRLLVLAAALTLAGPLAGASAQSVNTDPAEAPAGTYHLDKTHASVTMKLAHMGLSYYTMRFDGLDASYSYDPAQPTASKISVTIDPKSIDTGNPVLTREIVSDFFEADKFPTIVFSSTAVHVEAGDHGQVVGELTFHGVTRPITLDVVYNGTTLGLLHERRMGFSAIATIKRSEFGVTKFIPLVGDDVTVLVEAEFTK